MRLKELGATLFCLVLAPAILISLNGCSSAPENSSSAASAASGASTAATSPSVRGMYTTAPVTQPKIPPQVPASVMDLSKHPFLIVGEGCNIIYMVKGGKVVWTFQPPGKGEMDDVTQLSNGNILFSHQWYVMEITYPDGKVVWKYTCPPQTEIHSTEPIGLDHVLVMRNGIPPELMLINIHTNKVEKQFTLQMVPNPTAKDIHAQVRHVRMTAAGTYLVPYLTLNKVCEYAADGKTIIWSYPFHDPWAAIRLNNGDTLISGNQNRDVVEVNPAGQVVWQVTQADMPPGVVLRVIQEVDRLDNGDTVICNSSGHKLKLPQIIEVSPDKKVVWLVDEHTNILASGTSIQLLDQPGVPEKVGDQLR
ncbi:MAG TPA: hypothetical protein VMG59_07840 [Phycisphaerae bacterium]|nr:hypothetical protein [Phycisphaerae bacterium]